MTSLSVCPGSRSAPLAAAAARGRGGRNLKPISVTDERSAAFYALGHARSTSSPAAVLTSSGTAVANLLPAVVEASVDCVPMLVITADRPYEDRSRGANQAIDQTDALTPYTRWFRDVPPPSSSGATAKHCLEDIDHAYSSAVKGMGPVHLNIQVRGRP